ncbi:MAG TPA: AtaL-like protein [Steroidobacteraceae bacterium]|nr:AtaL-like protein [Steroidobacteraceae bacterium]
MPLTFEHIVRVNDLADPRLAPLSRNQLWQGLVRRAEMPRYFMPWLENVELTPQQDGSLARELDFGNFRVRDRVRFMEGESVSYEVEANAAVEHANVTMRIEEPAPGQLFVRFLYEIRSSQYDGLGELEGFVKDAYRQADNETVAGIRLLAANHLLDERPSCH